MHRLRRQRLPMNTLITLTKTKNRIVWSQISRRDCDNPQYTELKGVNKVALFAYRDAEAHKWGLVSTYDIITPPIYDNIKVVDAIRSDKTFANVTLNGKQGLLSPLGNEVLPLEYDSIAQPYWNPYVLEYKWGKQCLPPCFPRKEEWTMADCNLLQRCCRRQFPCRTTRKRAHQVLR